MLGLPSILSLFGNEFNKFNNTRARMSESIYHMTLKLNRVFTIYTRHYYYGRRYIPLHTVTKIYKPLVVYRFFYIWRHIIRRHDVIMINGCYIL